MNDDINAQPSTKSAISIEWKNAIELEEMVDSFSDAYKRKLTYAASIRSFLINSVKPISYAANGKWADFLSLTEAGIRAIETAGLQGEIGQASLLMAVFEDFYHHDLYVDLDKSNLKGIFHLVSEEIQQKRILIPNRFGRNLYDRFNDRYDEDRTDHLLPEQALGLLETEQQGVYQVGQLVSGPYGLAESPVKRYVPPHLSVPLWHCSDPGCTSRHNVRLLSGGGVFKQHLDELRRSMHDAHGPSSEWRVVLTNLLRPERCRDPFTFRDLGPLIADAIVGSERTSLVTAALQGEGGLRLREFLSAPPRKQSTGKGSAEQLASQLDDQEQLQLLYLLKDEELVRLIDLTVKRGQINVPANELREALNRLTTNSPSSTLSSLGVRCSGDDPLVDLCALIWDAYSSSDKLADLEWHLRSHVGATTTRNALLIYLCQKDPEEAVRNLVLSNGEVTRYIAEAISCPIEEAIDSTFTERVLWKLGFDIPRYAEPIQNLRRRLDAFNQELLAVGVLSTERDRERIRSVGVNLFVSVEEFLQEMIRYNVWILAADHFLDTKFIYDFREAQKSVVSVLGESVRSGDVTLSWNINGENTLGVLLAYMERAATWMKSLIEAAREPLERLETDLPHFSDDRFRVFPYHHTQLWADADAGALRRHADLFESICIKFQRSQLAKIRNGLDHNRDEASFPKVDEMLAFVARFREGLETAEANFFYPKEHWFEKATQDRYGRHSMVLVDYAGRQFRFSAPSIVHDIGVRLGIGYSVLIAPGNLLGFSNSEIIFKVRKPSLYGDYWKDYPRRRRIPSPHKKRDKAEEIG